MNHLSDGAKELLAYITKNGPKVTTEKMKEDGISLRSFQALERHGLARHTDRDHCTRIASAVELTNKGIRLTH